MNYFNRGAPVQFTAIFADSTGAAFDPSPLTFKYTDPTGATTTLTYGVDAALVKDAIGHYHVNYDIPSATTAVGYWLFRWAGTISDGVGVASFEGQFGVTKGDF